MGETEGPTSRELYDDLDAAYADFYAEIQAQSPQWGYWTSKGRKIIGPFTAGHVAAIYRVVLGIAFSLGVMFTLLSETTKELGVALVVGSLFAFGAWMAQAWALSREAEIRLVEQHLQAVQHAELKRHSERIREILQMSQHDADAPSSPEQ